MGETEVVILRRDCVTVDPGSDSGGGGEAMRSNATARRNPCNTVWGNDGSFSRRILGIERLFAAWAGEWEGKLRLAQSCRWARSKSPSDYSCASPPAQKHAITPQHAINRTHGLQIAVACALACL